jgi:dihydrofolate reductase
MPSARLARRGSLSKLRFHISMSLDGYVAGANQGLDAPLGEGAEELLHDWFTRTRTFKSMLGEQGEGETGLDNDRAEAWRQNFGATIMGRNMFGPIRGGARARPRGLGTARHQHRRRRVHRAAVPAPRPGR